MRIPLSIKLLWTACVIAWIPLYWRQYGLQNFLFFCDLGNLLIAAGLWLESGLVFSWQAKRPAAVPDSFHHRSGRSSGERRHLIGGTEYMFDPHIPLAIRC
jgi:hypothetical protein